MNEPKMMEGDAVAKFLSMFADEIQQQPILDSSAITELGIKRHRGKIERKDY